MKRLLTFFAGALIGAVSWGLAHAISGRFEPYDSSTGLLVTQVVLAAAAGWAGYRRGMIDAMILVAGTYAGLNGYAYAFGGSETRAWALLGAMASIGLVILPALAALIGAFAGHSAARPSRSKTESS